MHLGHQNTLSKYSLGGTLLEATVEEKDLGIIIDPHMNFRKQTAAAVSKSIPDVGSHEAFLCNYQ